MDPTTVLILVAGIIIWAVRWFRRRQTTSFAYARVATSDPGWSTGLFGYGEGKRIFCDWSQLDTLSWKHVYERLQMLRVAVEAGPSREYYESVEAPHLLVAAAVLYFHKLRRTEDVKPEFCVWLMSAIYYHEDISGRNRSTAQAACVAQVEEYGTLFKTDPCPDHEVLEPMPEVPRRLISSP